MSLPKKPPPRSQASPARTTTNTTAADATSNAARKPDDTDATNNILLGGGIGAGIATLLLILILAVLLAQRGCSSTGQNGDGSHMASAGGLGEGTGPGDGQGTGPGAGGGPDGGDGGGAGESGVGGANQDQEPASGGDGAASSAARSSPPSSGDRSNTDNKKTPRNSYAVRSLPPPSNTAATPEDDDLGAGGGGGIGGGGGGGGADFFGIKARGNKFVYVIDCSGSMSGLPYQKAADELRDSLKRLRPSQRVFVILFDNRDYPMFDPSVEKRLLPATPANIQQIDQWVRSNQHGGGTDPQSALLLGLQLKPDVIFLLTDGGFSSATVDVVTQQNNGRVAINTIGFMDRSGEQNLQQIAQQNRGKYRFVP